MMLRLMNGNDRILLLDCTLRDGGYVNDWNYGSGNLTYIFDRLNSAGVDVIEIGFLDDRRPADPNRTIQPDTQSLTQTFSMTAPHTAKVFAMIDYGTCSIDHVQPREETFLDGIRVIFKKPNMHKAADFGKQLMDKGYTISLNMVSITTYGDDDIKEFAEHVNRIKPFAVSIVDTYGLMHKEQMYHYFELLDRYLDRDIRIGYHSHNNFQLAYSNTIEMVKIHSDRKVIVDGSLYGMGKSAGNAPVELLAMHLNENYGKNYDISQLLEAIDVSIMPIYREHYWGYSMQFYIAAKDDCHPNFVKYLLNKKTLAIRDVDNILSMIEPERKLKYDEAYIESLYSEYTSARIRDSGDLKNVKETLGSRDLLLIGPGNSDNTEQDRIMKFIEEKRPVTVAVNFVPDFVKPDFIFLCNSKRYSFLFHKLENCGSKIIATSNITPLDKPFDYTVRYDYLVSENDEIWDNALVIIINLLGKMGIKEINLAGFDGFKSDVEKNYIDPSFKLSSDMAYLSAVNERLTKKIAEYRKTMTINFVTESIYDGKGQRYRRRHLRHRRHRLRFQRGDHPRPPGRPGGARGASRGRRDGAFPHRPSHRCQHREDARLSEGEGGAPDEDLQVHSGREISGRGLGLLWDRGPPEGTEIRGVPPRGGHQQARRLHREDARRFRPPSLLRRRGGHGPGGYPQQDPDRRKMHQEARLGEGPHGHDRGCLIGLQFGKGERHRLHRRPLRLRLPFSRGRPRGAQIRPYPVRDPRSSANHSLSKLMRSASTTSGRFRTRSLTFITYSPTIPMKNRLSETTVKTARPRTSSLKA